MAQQTAVEWLIEQLAKKHNEFQALTFYYDHKDQIEQAKKMEKEQMIDAFSNGAEWEKYEGTFDDKFKQYYNETYNK
jgi:phosphosulfolactate synthase (CoM biosynthesis protein A)